MKILVIISPDKLSMSMFCDFYKTIIIGESSYKELDINCLNSKEVQENTYTEFIKNNSKLEYIIIKYKTKPKTVLSIPSNIELGAQFIVKFDIFSSHPEIIKDLSGDVGAIMDRWNKNIEKLDKN